MGRTSSGRRVNQSGYGARQFSSEPSGPVVGPEIRATSNPGLARRPSTEAIVFSWAPPTINRVMTCVTRMTRGSRFRLATGAESLQAGLHKLRFRRARNGVGQIGLVTLDGGVGVFAAEGDFG